MGLCLFYAAGVSHAMEYPMTRFSYTEGSLSLRFTIDPRQTVLLESIPFPGTYLYSIKRGTLYVKHPDETQWYKISAPTFEQNLMEVKAVVQDPWEDYLGAPTNRWALVVGDTPCGHVFSSIRGAALTKMSMTELTRINNAIGYLYQGRPQEGSVDCQRYKVPLGLGWTLGLPVYSTGPQGSGEISEITEVFGDIIPIPTNALNLDEGARVRFMLRSLPVDIQRTFMRKNDNLPLALQARALEHLHHTLASSIEPQPHP